MTVKKIIKNPHCLITIIAVIAYAPITLLGLSMKNDMLHCYYKYFHIGECIQNGTLPLWNPYEYLGTPVHADPGGITWSPLMWIWSIIGVNTYTLHIVFIILIIIAGIGMYRLARKGFQYQKRTALILAIAYMTSGFVLGSAQFLTWISSVAMLPFIIHYALIVMGIWKTEQQSKAAIYLGAFCALMVTTGYPVFLIIAAYGLSGLGIISVLKSSMEQVQL